MGASLTRREALELLGIGAAAAALPKLAFAQMPAFPAGAAIRTVLRDYQPDELAGAATLFHEHLSLAEDFMPRWMRFSAQTRAQNVLDPPRGGLGGGRGAGGGNAPAEQGPFFMQDLDLMTDEMRIAKGDGIGCIVDGGHPDMGRDIGFLRQLSERSGMPIVAGAGFYTQPYYPSEIATLSEDQIVQRLVDQVRSDPIGAFGEIGSWDYMTKDERKVFRAVGRAHLQTDLPIFTHTGIPGKSALEQLDLLEDAGVDPRRVCIGHLGNLTDADVEIHRMICRRGAFIGFDRQGGNGDARQVPMVMTLIEHGYADNLLFSSDISTANQMKRNGGDGYAKTLTVFVPKLKAAGASDEVLRKIMDDNPRRFLAFVPKVPRPA